MSKIKVMSENLANKIAAGEVVEKMMSVVKELVENSIDAHADTISIRLEASGTKLIEVMDNGDGMDPKDALMSFQRHATSKLISDDDLFNIRTLGFRGEALASIASVSKVNMKTSNGKDNTEIEIDGGKVITNKNTSCNKGTIIQVRDIFFNTPARLKHIRSLYSELANIVDYVDKIALSHPNIRFSLVNDDSNLLTTDGSGNQLKVVRAIYGLEVTKLMIPIEGNNDDYTVNGFITKPEIHRSTKSGIITLVNGRVIKNYDLTRTINDAYHSYKPDNRYPIAVININVDPQLIDVNVHPTKMDIKFSKIEDLEMLINNLIVDAISTKNLVPEVETPYEEVNDDYIEPTYSPKEKKEQTELKFDTEEIKVDNETVSEEIKYGLERLPDMKALALVHGTYIICENDEGMYIIDHHAAEERINYEVMKELLGNPNPVSMDLLVPIVIELSSHDYIIYKNNKEVLEGLGFSIDDIGINTIRFKKIPTWIESGREKETINNMLEELVLCEKDFSLTRFREALSMMKACKMSIKANMHVSLVEEQALIEKLRKCKNPFNCPHGRPTIIKYTNYDLEKLFKRSGF